jgi:nitrite reductase/ring-hydroxylating ferredoxin subunit/uncharacterized membrane protein
MTVLDQVMQRIGQTNILDGPADRVSVAVSKVTHNAPVSTIVSGTWLGHPLHPVLTDVPIGAWSSALVLDLLGGRRSRRAAQSLVGVGVLGALPTALTGLADWVDTGAEARRLGIAHATLNSAALTFYTLSWRARRRGHHARGVALALGGATAVAAAATIGGHLVYRSGIGVDVNIFDTGPDEWTPIDDGSTPLTGIEGMHVTAADADVLALHNGDGSWRGVGARCSHRDGPLQEGTFEHGCVTCPWHHSRFDLRDGSVVDGPATAPQPLYDVVADAGRLKLRRRHTPAASVEPLMSATDDEE